MDEEQDVDDVDAYHRGDMCLVSVLAFHEGYPVCRPLKQEHGDLLHHGFLLAEVTSGDPANKGTVHMKVLQEFKLASKDDKWKIRTDNTLQKTLDVGEDGEHWSEDVEVDNKYILTRWNLSKIKGAHYVKERVDLRKKFLNKCPKFVKDVARRLRAQQSKCYVYN